MGASLLALAKVSYAKAGDLTAGFFFFQSNNYYL